MSAVSRFISSLISSSKPSEELSAVEKKGISRATVLLSKKGAEEMEATHEVAIPAFHEATFMENPTYVGILLDEPKHKTEKQTSQAQSVSQPGTDSTKNKQRTDAEIINVARASSRQQMNPIDHNPNSRFRQKNHTVTSTPPPIAATVSSIASGNGLANTKGKSREDNSVESKDVTRATSSSENQAPTVTVKNLILTAIKKPSNYKNVVNAMASSMVAINKSDYKSIEVDHLGSNVIEGRTEIKQVDTPVGKMTKRFNNMMALGAEMILDPSLSKKERTKLVEFYIDCADAAFKQGDLDGTRNFLAPLVNDPVERLREGDKPFITISEGHENKLKEIKQTYTNQGFSQEERSKFLAKTKSFPLPVQKLQSQAAAIDGSDMPKQERMERKQILLKDNQAKVGENSTQPKMAETLKAATNVTLDIDATYDNLQSMSRILKPKSK